MTLSSVTYIHHCGTDLTTVNAARVSFDKESDWVQQGYLNDETLELDGIERPKRFDKDCLDDWPAAFDENGIELSDFMLSNADTKLISYLAKHKHMTPFGHCFATFRVKAPIFVVRQLVKHEYLRINEISRRYVDSPPEYFLPSSWRMKAENVKQGSGDSFDSNDSEEFDIMARAVYNHADSIYHELLERGVCAEQARMVLPLAMMTEYYWSGSMDAFAKMSKLRVDSHSQKETQEIACLISDECAKLWPVSWKALMENT